jgi:cGMP-dependent protein kinase 1
MMDPKILESAEIREYKKDDVILHQEDVADGMYVIKEGKVEVDMNGEKIATLYEGDLFGEMGILLHAPRNATIKVASEFATMHYFSKEAFEKVKDEVGEEVIAKLFQRTAENCDR